MIGDRSPSTFAAIFIIAGFIYSELGFTGNLLKMDTLSRAG